MDTPDSDKFFTTEKELGTEPEFYLRLYSTATNPPTVLRSQNIGDSTFYENSLFLVTISAVALNKPYSEQIHFYDGNLLKIGQINTSPVDDNFNYIKNMSETPG